MATTLQAAEPPFAGTVEEPEFVPGPERAAPAATLRVPANTVIELTMIDSVSSKTNQPGDWFRLTLAEPLRSGTTELIPRGATAMGQVVHADRSRGGGKPGELILAARYLESSQGRVKLRSSFGASGRGREVGAVAAAQVIGPFALFVHGREVELPAGSPLSARIAEDTEFVLLP